MNGRFGDSAKQDAGAPPPSQLQLDPAAFAWSVAELLGDKFQEGGNERDDLWTEPSSWRTSRSSGSDWLGTPRTQAQVALAEQRKEIFDDEGDDNAAAAPTPRRRAELYDDDGASLLGDRRLVLVSTRRSVSKWNA